MKMYRVVDGSYTLANVAGEMKPASGNELFGRKFSLLASDCDLPAEPAAISSHRNNTIIADIKSGQIIFIQWRFLREIKYCPHCGHIIDREEE